MRIFIDHIELLYKLNDVARVGKIELFFRLKASVAETLEDDTTLLLHFA